MSNLPQRRKSAEEIAKLRESMGVPGAEQAGGPPPPGAPAVPATGGPSVAPAIHAPATPASQPRHFQAVDHSPPPLPQSAAVQAPAPVSAAPQQPKVVKSLRRSERVPIIPREPSSSPDSFLPVHRHSNAEIQQMDQVQAAPPDRAVTYLRSLGAHPLTLVLLYFLPAMAVVFGWGTPWFINFDDAYFSAEWMSKLSNVPHLDIAGKALTLISALAGLGLALRIALKKPRSRHHAGFATIAIIVILCFVFLT